MGIVERRGKEKLERIKRIQDAASKIFFKKGYAGTTMNAVAKKAELSKGTLYLYFKNKDELYISLMMPVLDQLDKLVRDLELKLLNQKTYTCKDVIIGLYGTMKSAYKSHTDGFRIIQSFHLNSYFSTISEEMRNIVHDKARKNLEVYRRILSRAVENKQVKKVNLYMLADIFWGLFLGMAQLEEAKLTVTGKDHIESTLEFSFNLISDAVDRGKKRN